MALLADWNASDTLTLIATLVAGASVVAGLFSYNRQQKWQRQTHVVDRMDRFLASGQSKDALIALDWISREIALSESASILVGSNKLSYNHDLLLKALEIDFHSGGNNSLVYLRDCFESLLDQIVVLEHQERTGLIRIEDVSPYLGYYAQRLLDKRRTIISQAVIDQFWAFSDFFYKQTNVRRFLTRVFEDYKRRSR